MIIATRQSQHASYSKKLTRGMTKISLCVGLGPMVAALWSTINTFICKKQISMRTLQQVARCATTSLIRVVTVIFLRLLFGNNDCLSVISFLLSICYRLAVFIDVLSVIVFFIDLLAIIVFYQFVIDYHVFHRCFIDYRVCFVDCLAIVIFYRSFIGFLVFIDFLSVIVFLSIS